MIQVEGHPPAAAVRLVVEAAMPEEEKKRYDRFRKMVLHVKMVILWQMHMVSYMVFKRFCGIVVWWSPVGLHSLPFSVRGQL